MYRIIVVMFLLHIFQGWEDILKLSTSFPDTFEKLPNDIQSHIDDWKEVRQLLTLLLSIRSILFYSDRFYPIIITNEINTKVVTYERGREICLLNLPKLFFSHCIKNAFGMPEF
jgi:hypothetical protein